MPTPTLVPIDDVMAQLTRVKDADVPALKRTLASASNLLTGMCIPLLPATVTDDLDGGQPTVILSQYPVNTVTSVTTYNTAGAGTTVLQAGGSTGVTDGWALEPLSGVLHRVGWRAWPVGWGNVHVVYTVGPATVPDEVAQATVTLTEHLWQFRKVGHQSGQQPGNDPQGYDPAYAIPNKVIELVRQYLKPPRVA
jgi:hypothetical protein